MIVNDEVQKESRATVTATMDNSIVEGVAEHHLEQKHVQPDELWEVLRLGSRLHLGGGLA